MAPFWISYSGLLSIRDYKGDYKPHNCEKDTKFQTIYKLLFLSFLGPLSILASQIVVSVGDLTRIFLRLVLSNRPWIANSVKIVTDRISCQILSVLPENFQALDYMDKTGKLFFEDLIMSLTNLMILTGILHCPEVQGSPFSVYFSLFTSSLSIVMQLVAMKAESKATGGSSLLLSLENMTARIRWLPFIKHIRTSEEPYIIEYGVLEGY